MCYDSPCPLLDLLFSSIKWYQMSKHSTQEPLRASDSKVYYSFRNWQSKGNPWASANQSEDPLISRRRDGKSLVGTFIGLVLMGGILLNNVRGDTNFKSPTPFGGMKNQRDSTLNVLGFRVPRVIKEEATWIV